MLLACWFSCASLVGLQELDRLPSAFPLTLPSEPGIITAPPAGGQVAVDVVFPTAEAARSGFAALAEQARAKGFRQTSRHVDKREEVVLTGDQGQITLGCCPRRADRRHLVFVTWLEDPPK